MKKTVGIILAGGAGTRMHPMTKVYSKQLISIYDKPMIYYPLSTLIMSGIKDILIISNKETIPHYQTLFQDGKWLGINIEYAVQDAPNGIAESFIIGENFIQDNQSVLILGDNLFYGYLDFLRNALNKNDGATIFGYFVNDPHRYGVVEFDSAGLALSIEEKPLDPKSNYAVPGLYVYDNQVIEIAKNLKPSKRGELEITDVNKKYMEMQKLSVVKLGRGIAWLDTGTPDSLLEASNFISSIEKRIGLKIGCIEEAAYRMGYINKDMMKKIIEEIKNSQYGKYLEMITKLN